MPAVQELQEDARRRADAGVPESVAQVLGNLPASIAPALAASSRPERRSLIDERGLENRRRSAARKWTSTSGRASWRNTSQARTTIFDHLFLGQLSKTTEEIAASDADFTARQVSEINEQLYTALSYRGRVI